MELILAVCTCIFSFWQTYFPRKFKNMVRDYKIESQPSLDDKQHQYFGIVKGNCSNEIPWRLLCAFKKWVLHLVLTLKQIRQQANLSISFCLWTEITAFLCNSFPAIKFLTATEQEQEGLVGIKISLSKM